jgi:hypothetical protein
MKLLCCYVIGLATLTCITAGLLGDWVLAPPLVIAGLLFWHTRKKWYATMPGLLIGAVFGFVTIRSRQPDVVFGAVLFVGALGGMINAICTGFFLSGLAALLSTFVSLQLMGYMLGY